MHSDLAIPFSAPTAEQPARLHYWYDAIIDLLLVEPTLTQKDIAIRLERHPATVGMIMNSDLFRARYEQRRGTQSAALTQAINTRLSRVALQALELTEEILTEEQTAIPLPA